MSSSTTSSAPTSNDSSSINIYPFIAAGSVLFLCIFQLIFSKFLCLKIFAPRRVTAETKRCCWDDGAFRKIEYHPDELKKIKPIGPCLQFLHHWLFVSSLMPTDDSFRAMARHHRAACFWSVFVTPLLTVTLLMKDPSALDLTTTASSSSSAVIIINENVFDPSSYELLSIILNCVCGLGACLVGRIFWSLFASAPRPLHLVPKLAAEREEKEKRTQLEQARDKRFAIIWVFWTIWMIGCLAIFVVFGMNLPSLASSSAPVMQHVVLSCVTLIVAFFIVDPIFCAILVCLLPKCACGSDVSKRLIHPGIFSLHMGNSGVESPLLSVEYEGTMKLTKPQQASRQNDSSAGSNQKNQNAQQDKNENNNQNDEAENNDTSNRNQNKRNRNTKKSTTKNNNNNNQKQDSDDEDPTARDRNLSDDCDDDLECDDEFDPLQATTEERQDYIQSKLENIDVWAELPPETSKDQSPLRVVKRSEVIAESEEEKSAREEEERQKRLDEIRNSGGLKAPKMNHDGTWSRPTFVNPTAPSSVSAAAGDLEKKKKNKKNKKDKDPWDTSSSSSADDEDDLDEHGLPRPSSGVNQNQQLQKVNNPLVVVSKTPMTSEQKKQLAKTQALDSKVSSILSQAQKVLEDAEQLEELSQMRKRRARQKELDKILEGQKEQEGDNTNNNKNNEKPYQSTLAKSLASLLGNGTRKHGTHGLSTEEQTLWETEQEMNNIGNNDDDDDDDCDDEAGGGGISLSQQVSVLNSIGVPSIVTSPKYSKNKNYQDQQLKKQIVPSKNREFDDFFGITTAPSSNSNDMLTTTTPSGARLKKQGFVKGDPEFDRLFAQDFSSPPSTNENNINNSNAIAPSTTTSSSVPRRITANGEVALSPLTIRRTNNNNVMMMNGRATSTTSPEKHRNVSQLGGLLDLPPPPQQQQSSPSSNKKVKLDPLDTTSEDDDDDDDEFTLPILPKSSYNNSKNMNNQNHQTTTSISIPASPMSSHQNNNNFSPSSSSVDTSSSSSPRKNPTLNNGRKMFGGGSGSRHVAGNNNNTQEEQQEKFGRNAFLPKVENDGEWKMVANPWEMI